MHLPEWRRSVESTSSRRPGSSPVNGWSSPLHGVRSYHLFRIRPSQFAGIRPAYFLSILPAGYKSEYQFIGFIRNKVKCQQRKERRNEVEISSVAEE